VIMAPPRRAAERGYNLVAVVMAVMVLNILVAAVLPLWSAAIRRDREEELISRGLQYAEAIRVFQKRFGRLPNTLQELRDVNPRSIRQLWRDPITDDTKWGLLLLGMGTPIEIPGQPPPPEPVGDVGDGAGEGDGGSAFGTPQLPAGPIRGVRSLSEEEGYRTFFEKTRYRDWEFSLELLASTQMPFQIGIGGIPPMRLSTRGIGRPFRYPPPGGLPGMPGAPPPIGVGGVPPPPPDKRGGDLEPPPGAGKQPPPEKW